MGEERRKKCDNCGKPLRNTRGRRPDQLHYFCSKKCYYAYLKNNDDIKGNFISKSSQLKKIEMLAKKRQEMLG